MLPLNLPIEILATRPPLRSALVPQRAAAARTFFLKISSAMSVPLQEKHDGQSHTAAHLVLYQTSTLLQQFEDPHQLSASCLPECNKELDFQYAF